MIDHWGASKLNTNVRKLMGSSKFIFNVWLKHRELWGRKGLQFKNTSEAEIKKKGPDDMPNACLGRKGWLMRNGCNKLAGLPGEGYLVLREDGDLLLDVDRDWLPNEIVYGWDGLSEIGALNWQNCRARVFVVE